MTSNERTFRIITFNLLSPVFSLPSRYHFSATEHLDPAYRLDKIMKLLGKWMKANFIICLQEVNNSWNNELKRMFRELRYSYTYAIYADGKMGVAIAFPITQFLRIDIDIYRCGESIGKICSSMNKIELSKRVHGIDHIEEQLINASEKDNLAITLLLKCRSFDTNFEKYLIVSTYHMPCSYTKKYFMVAHIHSLKSRIAELRSKWIHIHPQTPSLFDSIVIAGDFNITPNSPEYKYMTGEPYTPKERFECTSQNTSLQFYDDMCKIYKSVGINFNDTIPTLSTHLSINNAEPKYTNVMLQKQQNFINTLDYILITPNIRIMSCLVGLTCMTNPIASYPNSWCPSDHLPLSASLVI
jgi:mRNA deadenylase 3'-5' endonuclease subunit Ccr4